MIFALVAGVAAATQLPEGDIQEVLASWEAGQMYCERGNSKACADEKAYATKMRTQYGLCPAPNGQRGALIVCKTREKVEISFD